MSHLWLFRFARADVIGKLFIIRKYNDLYVVLWAEVTQMSISTDTALRYNRVLASFGLMIMSSD